MRYISTSEIYLTQTRHEPGAGGKYLKRIKKVYYVRVNNRTRNKAQFVFIGVVFKSNLSSIRKRMDCYSVLEGEASVMNGENITPPFTDGVAHPVERGRHWVTRFSGGYDALACQT